MASLEIVGSSDANADGITAALRAARKFGDYANAGLLETAYPAASYNGARATVAGALYEAINGTWTPVTGDVAADTHAATSKATPVDADELPLVDSAASNVLKKLTWANLKATAKTYFDTLYQAALVSGTNIKTINGSSILGSGDLTVSGGASGEYATFAALLADTASLTVGRVYTVTGAICTGGAYGTRWVWDGSRIRPAGRQILFDSRTQIDGVSGGLTGEQILLSRQIPAGVLSGVRRIEARTRWAFDAADPAVKTLRFRVGSAGDATDADVSSYGAAGSFRHAVLPLDVAPLSDTTVIAQYPANNSALTTATIAGSAAAMPSPVTVANMATTPVYVSISVSQGASPVATASLAWAFLAVE